MSTLKAAFEILEGKTVEYLIWLPTVTLGYMYTISGDPADFWLAIAATGGARLISQVWESDFVDKEEESIRSDAKDWITTNIPIKRAIPLVLLYLTGLLRSFWQLYAYFDYQDPIIVGLSGIYWGSLFIVVTSFNT